MQRAKSNPPLVKALIAVGLAGGAFFAAAALGFTALGTQFDNNIYDFLFRAMPPPPVASHAALVVFDERTYREHGGVRALRSTLAALMDRLAGARPAVVAVDLTLADRGDPAEDARLAESLGRIKNLVLACEMAAGESAWQEPLPAFRARAAGVGHVHALAGPYDDINRRVTLERVAGRERRWALSLEALRVFDAAGSILASPSDLTLGRRIIASRWDQGRPLRVRYLEGAIPVISAADVLAGQRLAGLNGKAVFIGITATSAVPDRLFTPLSRGVPMPGVMIHAQAFQTMEAGIPLSDVPLSAALLLALAAISAVTCALFYLRGWSAWAVAAAVIALVHALPASLFSQGLVLAAFPPVAGVWIAALASALARYFLVRLRLDVSEAQTARYQQAFHFVAHEMRTPLTAIQGSSELMARYNLPEDKRREMGRMINAESKRLARMITTFLDVEKLSAGQMELRRAQFDIATLVDTCYQRALPLAERKRILITSRIDDGILIDADRELMEYALYNLITNAIKYSPPETEVVLSAQSDAAGVTIDVTDHGMGMDQAEVKKLFRKFYRTSAAERSGETGSGIGLSIVKQIIDHHGGSVGVESTPGQGSTFRVTLPRTIH